MKQNTNETKEIPNIISYFDLGEIQKIGTSKSGISNHNYLVKTKQNNYFVKFLINQDVKYIQNDVYIQKSLKKVGVDSPNYLQSKTGEYVYEYNNVKAVVSKRIIGDTPFNVNAKLAFEFGEKLAKFHKYVIELPIMNVGGLMNPNISSVDSDIFTKSLPKGIIHGDFHLGNALVDLENKDTIVAILDFEDAGENIFVVDLAVTIMGICSKDENSVDISLINKTISGYQSVRLLNDFEKKCLNDAILYSAKTWIKWFMDNGYEKYAKRHQSKLDSFYEIEKELDF